MFGLSLRNIVERHLEVEFDYESFLRRMRHPSCRPLITQLKNFINHFKQCAPVVPTNQLVHQYRDFKDRIMYAIRENPVWRLRGEQHPEEYEFAHEGIEYLLMNQLYTVAFAPTEDSDRDEHINRKMALHGSWLEATHLDIRNELHCDPDALLSAITEFKRVNEFLTPRDKLTCLLNGCRIIQNLVETTSPGASADEIMPILILTIIKANVAQFYSNLHYISRYRDQRALASDNAYHFTSLLAVSTFIEKMNQESLVIAEEEYNAKMEEAIMKLNEQTIKIEEDESVAREWQLMEEQNRQERQQAKTMSSETQFKDDATRVLLNVKEKVKLSASKSIDYLSKLMDDAEAKIKAAISSSDNSPQEDPEADRVARERALLDEDEFQLQLAMALSISEQEYNEQRTDKEKTPTSSAKDEPLIDIHESDNGAHSTEPS